MVKKKSGKKKSPEKTDVVRELKTQRIVDMTDKPRMPEVLTVTESIGSIKEQLRILINEFPELPLTITQREYGEKYYPEQRKWLAKLKKLAGM